MNEAPQLLVNWSSRWEGFLSALGPALRPSPPKLRIEARAGLFPLRGMAFSLLLEVVALATAIAHPARAVEPALAEPVNRAHEVIYFSSDELPQTEDLGGAAAGAHGARGGASQAHASQTIRVARDHVLRDKVADAPQLDLPKSDSQISNLLAYKSDALPVAPPKPRPGVPALPIVERATLKRQTPAMTVAVAPPPPEVEASRSRSEPLPTLAAPAVAPPPVAAPVQTRSRAAQLALPAATVAPPTPVMEATLQPGQILGGAVPAVAPPPVQLDETRRGLRSLGNTAVAPPAPDLPAGAAQPSHVPGLGIAHVQPPRATPESSVAASKTGIVISPQPGNQAAAPALLEKGTLAMSPAGSARTGSDGEGGGNGISRGKGPGAAPSGSNPGATSTGAGKSTVTMARNTNSPYPGPGGAGIMNHGSVKVPGVSVSGGKNVITLPSFGSTPEPNAMAHSAAAKNLGNGITVVASPRAGGALNLYGLLKGDRVYTIYINTKMGTAVMQFADPTSLGHPYANQLVAPRALRVETPAGWSEAQHSKVLIACEVDRTGLLKNAHVLQTDDSAAAQQVIAVLGHWKFSPAFRGNDPVEVSAILGFGVDTK